VKAAVFAGHGGLLLPEAVKRVCSILQYAPGFADCGLRETVPAEFAQAGADYGLGFGFQAIFRRIIAAFSPFLLRDVMVMTGKNLIM